MEVEVVQELQNEDGVGEEVEMELVQELQDEEEVGVVQEL